MLIVAELELPPPGVGLGHVVQDRNRGVANRQSRSAEHGEAGQTQREPDWRNLVRRAGRPVLDHLQADLPG